MIITGRYIKASGYHCVSISRTYSSVVYRHDAGKRRDQRYVGVYYRLYASVECVCAIVTGVLQITTWRFIAVCIPL